MKLVGLSCAVLFLIGALAPAKTSVSPSEPFAPTPVVVELFTSEGCSSCPPADRLLAELEASQPVSGAQIIAVEEHVDYWNHLGWADPFSSSQWTGRQQDYAAAFREDGEYTPEMVVGGRQEFVGSRSDLATKAIEEALKLPPVTVTLTKSAADPSAPPRFSLRVGKLPRVLDGDSAEVWLLVTESGLASKVSAGENAGRLLAHASVLRSLDRIATADGRRDTSFEGTVSVKLKPEWKRQNLMAVVLVQEKKSRHILGAASSRVAG